MATKLLIILAIIPLLVGVEVQNDPIGKNYKALVGETCKEMTNGGCMIYTYRILNFKLDSVVVSYQVIAACLPKELDNNYTHMYDDLIETYSWSAQNDTITINGLDDYGPLTFQNSKLIGEDKFTKRPIEFIEEL